MKSAPASGPHTQKVTQASTGSISRQGQRSKPRRVTKEGRIKSGHALTSRFRNYDAQSAIDLYLDEFPEYRPAAFRASGFKTKQIAEKLWLNEKSWLYRLWMMQSLGQIDLRFYSLHHTHLGLPAECADYRRFFDPENIKKWRQALESAFPDAPIKWFLHIGARGRIHAHVFTDHRRCVAPKIKTAACGKSQVIQLIRDEKTLLRRAAYVHKSPMHWPTFVNPSRDHVYMWAAAVEDKKLRGAARLPQTSGVKNIPKLEHIQNAKITYAPGDPVTPAVWRQAREDFALCLEAEESTDYCARYYLENFPECPPDLFLKHGLPLDYETLTDYLDLCRILTDLEPIDNFFGKSSIHHLSLFNDFRFDPESFDRKLERKLELRQRYRRQREF